MSVGERTPWESLRHAGLLLGPAQVRAVEQDFAVPPLPESALLALRREMLRLDANPEHASDFVHWSLTHALGLGDASAGAWKRTQHVDAKYSQTLLSGEVLKPRQVWTGINFGVVPVFLDKSPRVGLHRSRKVVSDVLQWLRRARLPAALVTNARQWRIVHAGLDSDASCEADLDQWLEDGREGLQLNALRHLLQARLWDPPGPGEPAPLAALIAASRKGQAELSSVLGERVREAVERLVRAHGHALTQAGLEGHGADIYRAAVRVVMRMVVVLFAESRDLLPRTIPAFFDSYSLQNLFDQLQRQASRGSARLRDRHAAWPRVLALFRLIFEGSNHERLTIRQYGGELFAPGDPTAPDARTRALAVFESACFDPRLQAMPDEVVLGMLELLTRTRVRIRQGRGSTTTPMPVDFSDLSSEYIGILYEGLLDYELRTAPADDAIVFLAVGNEPSLPLSRLEAMDDAQIKQVVAELGKKQKAEDAEDEAEDDDPSDPTDPTDPADLIDPAETPEPAAPTTVHARALAWTRRAALAAGFVKKTKGKPSPEKQAQDERAADAAARGLLRRLVGPGEWYLVRWGGTRKGSGSFYTRPQLAIPLVQRTLRPLAYTPSDPSDQSDPTDPTEPLWTPKPPEQILALKVADIACGSGSMPVAALRFLTEALYESLWAHGRIQGENWRQPLPALLGLPVADSLQAKRLPVPPTEPDFEPRTKVLLRRYVVERCLYGVDFDPIAAELCRLALWIETMDRDLPFSFLDHKIKHGNSLVGAWFDQYRHYPVLAWKREGGDKTHANGVHFAKEARTRALKAFLDDQVKPDLLRVLTGQGDFFAGGMPPADSASLHDQALAELRAIHDLPVDESADRARRFKALTQRPDWQRLKAAFDRWCACWFWPADRLDAAPLPSTFAQPSEATERLAADLAAQKCFFHWELEFPDVFHSPGSGFHAILGNPPWEVAKPNSKEFFSNLDPLYRTYGKQEALRRQSAHFADADVERAWLNYCADFKCMSQYVGCCAFPQGDPADEAKGADVFSFGRGRVTADRHRQWREKRSGSAGYADAAHPFRHQGSADLNLYKLFLEHAHALLGAQGRLGYIVPSGIYSDHGSGSLRTLFLDHCRWEWLFGFENREGIFDIDSRFKFNPVIVQKGGRTEAIRTAFMRRDLDDWTEAERHATPYARDRVERFSPKSKAILEIQSARDLEILEKIYANSVLLGDQGPDGWGIKYATEFHMTNDSKLFPPRPVWEAQGYQPDEYSRWLKGHWQPISGLWNSLGLDLPPPGTRRCAQPPYDTLPLPRADLPPGIILNRDASQFIRETEVEDIALPLYEGRMIGQFDFSQKGWVSGKGRSAVWREIPWDRKQVEPQYLMALTVFQEEQLERYLKACKKARGEDFAEEEERRLQDPAELNRWWNAGRIRTSFIDVTAATNTRTTFAALIIETPCGNSAPILRAPTGVSSVLNSLAFDAVARFRCTGLHLNWFVIEEAGLPELLESRSARFISFTLRMTGLATRYAELWARQVGTDATQSWRGLWVLTEQERTRVRVNVDCVMAASYGLSSDELEYIMLDCDRPKSQLLAMQERLNTKGFWRVDKDQDPELRHTVLTLVAFHDLQAKIAACGGDRERGIEAFLAQNDGQGWLLPETLRLADYGFGHDDRAQHPQPVASRLGPRFLDWQLAQSPEESWRECHLHARNLLGEPGYQALLAEIDGKSSAYPQANSVPSVVEETPTLYASPEKPVQRELFDE